MWQRYIWIAYLVLVTIIAVLSAGMVKSYLTTALMAPVTAGQASALAIIEPLTPKHSPSEYEVVAERNIFNANPPQSGAARPPPPPPPPEPTTPDVQPTKRDLILVGIVAGGQAQRYAIIQEKGSRDAQQLYQIGDIIQQASIVEIRPDCVFLQARDQREALCFQNDTEAPTPTPSNGAATSEGSPAVSEGRDLDTNEGVVRVDRGTWRVSRELIMENFADLGALSTQARVTPHVVQGQATGFRLTQLKRGTLLRRIGLQNGDILQKVNGLNIHSPQEALQAYQALQSEATVRLEILRRSRATTLTYEIR